MGYVPRNDEQRVSYRVAETVGGLFERPSEGPEELPEGSIE
jgi:hypothetical protein